MDDTVTNGLRVTTEDYHTGGEPFRIVTGGTPEPVGDTVAERRLWAREHLDFVRQLLVNEPRGHADMYGGFVTQPDDPGADLGVVFFHNDGFSTACGHGTIALATWAVESGRVAAPDDGEIDLLIDVPSGRLPVRVVVEDGQVQGVVFGNVPSFVAADVSVDNGDGGCALVSIAFGGAFYAVTPAADFGLRIDPADLPRIIKICRKVKDQLNADQQWVHPTDDRIRDIYGVILVESCDPVAVPPALRLGNSDLGLLTQRNVTIFANGQVDRSPTGSGTSARLAVLHRDGQIGTGQGLVNVSIVDSLMGGVVDGTVTVGQTTGVRTRVSGRAFRTGGHAFTLNPDDPLGTGFQLR